jgi:predicted AAA+ superfamily ATPase
VFQLPPYFWNTSKRLVKSPKLYFHDVGLAAYLLGIQNESHVQSHPLRGALFETLVVGEALKWFWHRGRRAGLHFYRDSDGNEVDLLLELGNGVFPIEIKAGETVNPDYFKGLRAFARLYEPPPPNGGALIYAGDEAQTRHGTTVLAIAGLSALLGTLAG